MKNKGFSLVELIVVIAIMAILVGVAVPVYTSYISKAQKNKDIQMVDEIKHAIEIKLIAENATSCVGGVCVTTKGTSIIGCSAGDGSYELIMATLEETFGLDWDQMKLDYDGWAGGKTTAAALSNFGTWTGDLAGLVAEGEDLVAPSYVNEIEDMFSLIKDTATFVGGALDTGAASLVKDAASLTMSGSTSAEDFAKYYAGSEWDSSFLMGENADDYTEVGEEGYATDVLSSAIANAAVIKARNTAFANYLRINGVSETTCSKVENLSLGTSGYASHVPADIATEWVNIECSDEDFDKLAELLFTYFSEGEDGDVTQSQAYIDGLAYYAMMNTVDALQTSAGADDDAYWNNMSDAVGVYAQIARGEITLTELNELQSAINGVADDNAVFITVVENKVSVAPATVLG